MTTQPKVSWAQRKDRLFVTVDIQDIEGETVALTAEGVKIAGTVRASRWLPPASPRAADPGRVYSRRAETRSTPSTSTSSRRWTRMTRSVPPAPLAPSSF